MEDDETATASSLRLNLSHKNIISSYAYYLYG